MNFDWHEIAFNSKKPINVLKPIFIAAPREISAKRFKELIKTYLPKGNILLGIAKEKYIDGFEGQQQFRTLRLDEVQAVINKVNKASKKNKIATLSYNQRELKYIIEALDFTHVVLINGSWKYVFHSSKAFYEITKKQLPYTYISPFASEQEAKEYEAQYRDELKFKIGPYTAEEMLAIAATVAELSYDNSFQTGAVLGKKRGLKYAYVTSAFNKVVPYQTYAFHHGNQREKNFSAPHDLNFYDTIHAETSILIQALKKKLQLANTTLFINLLPCPSCARMLTQTDIKEVVYSVDHSDGYAVRLLEEAGKKVRRLL
nr:Cytidine and deoxycytidylate deaminase zinc-binding region [uncultured bacterium]